MIKDDIMQGLIISRGEYIKRRYLLPAIEFENTCEISYLCLTWRK